MQRRILNKENGLVYKLQFDKVVEHDRITDSYILWNLYLESNEELECLCITQYFYCESLEECFNAYNYEIITD